MLSLKMLFDGNRAEGITAEIALHIGDERFAIRVANGELAIARGEIDNPDAVIDTDTATLLSIVRAEQSVDDALQRSPTTDGESARCRELRASVSVAH